MKSRFFFKSAFSWILLAFLGLFAFSCHTPSSSKLQTLRINLKDEPQTLDPRKARDLNTMTLMKMLFEGLTRINKEGEVELAIAEKIEYSPSMTEVTFFLKEARWINGDPVTAEDFSRTWRQCLDPLFPCDLAFQLYAIKNAKQVKEGALPMEALGIEVLDSRSFRVQLEAPTPYFLKLLAAPPFFPVHPKAFLDQKEGVIVNNGPFYLDTWKPQDHLRVLKNPQYWDAAQVRLDEVYLTMVSEETEFMLFEKNQLDWAGSPLSVLPLEVLHVLKQQHQLQIKEMLGTYFLRANTQAGPLQHPKIRQALALAVNRQALIEHVTQGNQIPATGLVPISLGLQKEAYFKDGDTALALQLFNEALEELELSRDNFPSTSLMYYSRERNRMIAQALQQQWFEVFGVRINLEAIEGRVYFDRVAKTDYQLAAGSWVADFEDPMNFLDVFKYPQGSANNTLWHHPEYTALLDQARLEADETKRSQLMASAEKILVDAMPIIPIFYYTMLYVNRPEVKDVVLSKTGQLDFKWAYIEKEAKR